MKRCDRLSLAISEVLDARRRALDLTIAELATRLGGHASTVSQQLDGRTMRTSTITRYEAALGCELMVSVRLKR